MRVPTKFTKFYDKWVRAWVLRDVQSIESLEQKLGAEELTLKYYRHMIPFLEENGIKSYAGVYLNARDNYEKQYTTKIKKINRLIEHVKGIDIGKQYPPDVIYKQLKKLPVIQDISIDSYGRLVITTGGLTYEHDIAIGRYKIVIPPNTNRPSIYSVSYPMLGNRFGAQHPHINGDGHVCWGYWDQDLLTYMRKGDLLGVITTCIVMIQESYSGNSEYLSKETFVYYICKLTGQEYPQAYGSEPCHGGEDDWRRDLESSSNQEEEHPEEEEENIYNW